MFDINEHPTVIMEHVRVRPASMSDLPVLLEFEQGVIAAERPFDPTLREGPIRYYDIEELILSPDAEIVVAQIADEIVASGYARVRDAKPFLNHTHYAYLGFMYVVPAWRGRGINRKIIGALRDWTLSKGLSEMRLDVYAENAAAIAAYEKVGFSYHMTEMRMSI